MEQNHSDVKEDEIWHNSVSTEVINDRRYTKNKKCQIMIPAERKKREANYYNCRRLQNNLLELHGPSLRLDSPVPSDYLSTYGFSGGNGNLSISRKKGIRH